MSHWPWSTSWIERSASATGSSGTSVDSGRQLPAAANNLSEDRAAAVETRRVLPMPASPLTSSRPASPSRCRRAAASSSRRPAIRSSGTAGPASGVLAASHRARNPSTSPSIASTRSSSRPQDGSRGEEKTAETVVGLHPAARASTRRLGQPARWCRSWSASTRSRCGPGARSGRGRAPMRPPGSLRAALRPASSAPPRLSTTFAPVQLRPLVSTDLPAAGRWWSTHRTGPAS